MTENNQIPPTKIDVNELIQPYKVENVDAFELYLTGVWKDLASRSDNKYMGINKITFSKYYELPGIIFDRLFNVFDTGKTEYLDLNCFLQGMLTLFSKDFEDLVKFIFHFYDFDKDGKISKEDIRIVLSYVPLNRSKIAKKGEDDEFKERVESQDELHNTLDTIFQDKEKIDEPEFVSIIENINSDVFLFILIFLYEKRPFNKKTIQLLENIKKSPVLQIQNSPRNNKLIASPNLNSIFQPSSTITKSPGFRRTKSDLEEIDNHANYDKKHSFVIDPKNEKTELLLKLAGKSMAKPKPKGATLGFKPNVTIKKQQEKKLTTPQRNDRHLMGELSKMDEIEKEQKKEVEPISEEKENEENQIQPAVKFDEKHKFSQNDLSESGSEESDGGNNSVEEETEDKEKGNYSGYIYKVTHTKKLKKLWFSLIYKDLYYYKSKEDKLHKGMHNLSGVFLKEEGECNLFGKKCYSFSLILERKPKVHYVETLEEYNGWIKNLKKAIGYSDLNDLYEIKEKVGKGRFGLVRRGINKITKEDVAIKIMSKKNMSIFDLEQVKNEIEILKIANHPNIVKLYDVFENIDYFYIIMEYCAGGDFFSYIEDRNFKMTEERASQIIQQLSTAVYFLHEYGIVHRDLKPENILMTDKTDEANIKLLDFGLGKILGPGECCSEAFGTLSYVAPEVLLEKPYNKAVDLWAIGVITYLLVSGFLPFYDENSDREIARQTINDPTPFPPAIWRKISSEAKDFVSNLLSKDPEKRMTIKEVLEHPWLHKYLKDPVTSPLKAKNSLSGGQEFKIYSSPSLSPRGSAEISSSGFKLEDDKESKHTLSIPGGGNTLSVGCPVVGGGNTLSVGCPVVSGGNTLSVGCPVVGGGNTLSTGGESEGNTLSIPVANVNLPIFTKLKK